MPGKGRASRRFEISLRFGRITQPLVTHRQKEEIVGATPSGVHFDADLQRRYGVGQLAESVIDDSQGDGLEHAEVVPVSVGHFLLEVMAQPALEPNDLPPITREASGMLTLMTDEEARKALDEHRTRKYGNG